MKNPSNERWVSYVVVATVALIMLFVGLNNFGIWQPSEVHVADLARDLVAGNSVRYDRPPLQVRAVAAGFRLGNLPELYGRVPGALLAAAALAALMAAARSLGDRRLAVYTGIAYVTLPLVFMNARQMLGGGIAQSATTLALSGLAMAFWAQHKRWQLGGAVTAAVGLALAAGGAGVMVGLVPVLGAVGMAVLLRFAGETRQTRILGAVATVAAAALAVKAFFVASRELSGYSAWVGASDLAQRPSQWQTYELYFENLAHGSFPWTGLVPFGLVRLVSPPSPISDDARHLLDDDEHDALDPWREGALRLAAFIAVALGFAVQTFHMQVYGMSAFVVVAPVALGVGVLLRDCEREMRPWRTVAVAAGLLTALMLRDYLQFPKSAYAALGLADGGPAFPAGFSVKFSQWLSDLKAARAAGGSIPPLPAEGYYLLETVIFLGLGVLVLFQGAGEVKSIAYERPWQWVLETEHEGREALVRDRKELGRGSAGAYLLAHFRKTLAAIAATIIVLAISLPRVPAIAVKLTTPARDAFARAAALPIVVVVGVFVFIAVWNFYGWLGRRGTPVSNALGSRVAWVPIAAFVVSAVIAQFFMPALSEHMSPRGVWAVVNQLRIGNERVGRFGGPPEDPASRYYARGFTPETIGSEEEAVSWLTGSDRRFVVVGSDVFGSLNRSYRRLRRQNIPVADSSNSNLLLAVTSLGERPNRNPLEQWISTNKPRMRHEARQASRLDEFIEYVGYDLDSRGQSFVPIGGSFDITFVFHCLAETPRNWQVFVHVDGPGGPRINGDHDPVEGKYPVRLWQPGDYVRDKINIAIPVTYRPGIYTVFIGFFDGGDRMRVEGGDHDHENRVIAARVRVQ